MVDENTSPSGQTAKKPNWIMIGIVALVGVVLLAFVLGVFGEKDTAETSVISGNINFNGFTPTGDGAGKIIITQRPVGSGAQFMPTDANVTLTDQVKWIWTGAEAGVTYEIKADGYYNDEFIKSSNTLTTTAPAADLTLTFNVLAGDLPESITPPEAAEVSGTIVINGFIPVGATATIFGRLSDSEDDFQPAVEAIPASNGATWTYADAAPGVSYDYQAELYTSTGAFIGQSAYLTVTAPAANEVVVINSTATPPSQQAELSGTVTLQGPVTQGSTILLLQRESGEAEYTAFDRLPAAQSSTWTWDDAVAGTAYDITAALQVNEQNTATGDVQTVTAPAENVKLVIDTGVNLTPPQETVSVACGDPDATNHFNARVKLPQITGAKIYYLQVGTSAGANNTFASTLKPGETATVFVPGNSPHFARYSYSACTDCNIQDTGNWAGWSPTLGFTCPQ